MKNSFILYHDNEEIFKALSDEQAGKLIKHIYYFSVKNECPVIDDPVVNMAFISIKGSLLRNIEKYKKTCERNKNNGLKGGRPKNQKKPKKPTGLNENPKKPKKADSDSDSDSDSEPVSKNSIEQEFEKFWSFYPKKRSKGQALKTWNKLKKSKKLPDLSLIMESLRQLKTSKDWMKDQGQFIPYPSTWLNSYGWDDVPENSVPMVSNTLIHNANVGKEWLNESE